jgi:hypothetical protein
MASVKDRKLAPSALMRLMQYHQGQSTMPRLLALLRSMGIAISKRQLVRLLNQNREGFVAEAQDVLRAGLETSPRARSGGALVRNGR